MYADRYVLRTINVIGNVPETPAVTGSLRASFTDEGYDTILDIRRMTIARDR